MKKKSNSSQVVFLKGRKVILRPLNKKTDLEPCLRWINDPDVRQFVKAYLPKTEADEEKWFDGLTGNKNVVLAIETFDGRFIGTIGLHGIDWHNRTATTGTLIGEKKFWGKGFGTDAKMVLLDYAFNTLGLEKINSSVYEFNERSIRYSLHCGYRKEGEQRSQVLRGGKRWSVVLLGIQKEDWQPIWEKYKKTGAIR